MAKRATQTKRKFQAPKLDYIFLAVVVIMVLFSWLMMYSVSMSDGGVPGNILLKHTAWLVGGLFVMAFFAWVPYTFWKNATPLIMVVLVILLVLVPIFGRYKYGARRAFEIGPPENPYFSLQPGVVARLVVVMYVATWAVARGEQLRTVIVGLIPFGLIIGSIAGLIAAQPDWSIVIMIVVVGIMMFFYAGGDPVQLTLSGALMGGVLYLFVSQVSYILKRVQQFVIHIGQEVPIETLRENQGYWTLLGMKHGGLFGQGLGQGVLKYGYIALTYNDAVLSVIGEELGWLGVMVILGLFVMLAYRGYRIAEETTDQFGSLLVFGVTSMIVLSTLLHFAAVGGVIPFVGIALPVFSYGGTETLTAMAGLGLILSVSRGKPKGEFYANLDRRWRNWWARVPGSRRSSSRPSYGS